MDYNKLMEELALLEECEFDAEFVNKIKNIICGARNIYHNDFNCGRDSKLQYNRIMFFAWGLIDKKLQELPYYLSDNAIKNIINGIIHSEMAIDSITTIGDSALIEGIGTFNVCMPRLSVIYDDRLSEITDPKIKGFGMGRQVEEIINKLISIVNKVIGKMNGIDELLSNNNGSVSYSIPKVKVFIDKKIEELINDLGNNNVASFQVVIQRENEEVITYRVLMNEHNICVSEDNSEVIVLFDGQEKTK